MVAAAMLASQDPRLAEPCRRRPAVGVGGGKDDALGTTPMLAQGGGAAASSRGGGAGLHGLPRGALDSAVLHQLPGAAERRQRSSREIKRCTSVALCSTRDLSRCGRRGTLGRGRAHGGVACNAMTSGRWIGTTPARGRCVSCTPRKNTNASPPRCIWSRFTRQYPTPCKGGTPFAPLDETQTPPRPRLRPPHIPAHLWRLKPLRALLRDPPGTMPAAHPERVREQPGRHHRRTVCIVVPYRSETKTEWLFLSTTADPPRSRSHCTAAPRPRRCSRCICPSTAGPTAGCRSRPGQSALAP